MSFYLNLKACFKEVIRASNIIKILFQAHLLLCYNFSMWNIRMRASDGRRHISGAETICEEEEILKFSEEFIKRALSHSKGKPSEVVLTIERIKQKPLIAPLLKPQTLECRSPEEAKGIIKELLMKAGVKSTAISKALRIIYSGNTMRGASLMDASKGVRLEPDRLRGIRVSRLGIEPASSHRFTELLESLGINILRTREALILASKVAACPGIIAEVCISDDPDYTTGYVASKGLGYLRIPNIKRKGSPAGGRVFFVKGKSIKKIIEYLEKKPVLIRC